MFRFTIREVMLLTLAVAIGVAFWLSHREQESFILRLRGYAERQHHALAVARADMVESAATIERATDEIADLIAGRQPRQPPKLAVICRIEEKVDWGTLDEPIPRR